MKGCIAVRISVCLSSEINITSDENNADEGEDIEADGGTE